MARKVSTPSKNGICVCVLLIYLKEYQANPLASDSEDEKRMMRAEARASRKLKQRRFEKARRMPNRYHPYPPPTATVTSATAQQEQGNLIPTVRTVRRGRPGVCFGCGKSGHWKYECLAGESGSKPADKISISVLDQFSLSINAPLCASVFSRDTANGQAINSTGISNDRISPVGRLKDRVHVWDQLSVDRYIRDVIVNGYKLPFKELPEKVILDNNRSAKDNPEFVSCEIQNLLKLKCVSEVSQAPHVVNPLTVAYGKSGKPRLVLDCRHINPHLMKFKHKYEDTNVARQLFGNNEFLFTYDLQSAYHIIAIFSGPGADHRQFLGFSWGGKFYVFNVLVFGLNTAGFIFSKLMRCPVRYFRSQGHKLVMFLDDGIGGHVDRETARRLSSQVHETLIKLGFLISEAKCKWEPAQSAVWLGHHWDTISNTIRITDERISRLENAIDSLMFQLKSDGTQILPVRFLASVVGQIVSLQQVLGGLVCLRTRSLYHCIDSRLGWGSFVYIDQSAVEELHFWRENAKSLNEKGMAICEQRSAEVSVFSDASGTGYGGYVALCAGALVEGTEVYGCWDEAEVCQSSTWRELASVERVLKSNESSLSQKSIKVFSDNKNVSSILRKGSMKQSLQTLAMSVHEFCEKGQIQMASEWISRESAPLALADEFSRAFDNDDWEVKSHIFCQLSNMWGKFSVDRFASNLNCKCIRFNSRVWCVGSEAVDALAQTWSGELNWWVPPPKLIAKCVNKIVSEKASGTLVIPVWESAPFWPLISENSVFRDFVKDHRLLPQVNVIKAGKGNNGIFAEEPLKFKMIALKISF